jgi:multicomponent Na+:H+ antiporter subunit F
MNISAVDIAFALLAISLLMALVRLFRGPSLPDRIVALELTSMLSVGIILVQVIEIGESLLLDVAIVVALMAFLGTITFAYYAERAGRRG